MPLCAKGVEAGFVVSVCGAHWRQSYFSGASRRCGEAVPGAVFAARTDTRQAPSLQSSPADLSGRVVGARIGVHRSSASDAEAGVCAARAHDRRVPQEQQRVGLEEPRVFPAANSDPVPRHTTDRRHRPRVFRSEQVRSGCEGRVFGVLSEAV